MRLQLLDDVGHVLRDEPFRLNEKTARNLIDWLYLCMAETRMAAVPWKGSVRAPIPAEKPKYRARRCIHCGYKFTPNGPAQIYCHNPCNEED